MVKYREDLRRELEALRSKAESVFKRRGATAGAARGSVRPGSRAEERASRTAGRGPAAARASGPLSALVRGEEVSSAAGTFYRVLAEGGEIWEDTEQFHREYLDALGGPFPPEARGLEPLATLKEIRPVDICYLDLETTGLRMAPLCIVGLMYSEGDRLVVDQLFARDYGEEPAVLQFAKEVLARFQAIVTFNGVRFDVPFLRERMTIAGIGFAEPGIHVDLLPLARKVMRGRTPDHRLQTLEGYLCRRKRIGDVPGSEIPEIYHEFVRTGDAGDMAAVFHHNRLDLLTMLQLVTVFLAARE